MEKEGLKGSSEFKRVFSKGNRKSGRYITVYLLSGQQGNSKVGIIIKKSIGKAVQRNKIKRRLRAIWHRKCKRIISGCYVIILARREILQAPFTEIEQELLRLLQINNISKH